MEESTDGAYKILHMKKIFDPFVADFASCNLNITFGAVLRKTPEYIGPTCYAFHSKLLGWSESQVIGG